MNHGIFLMFLKVINFFSFLIIIKNIYGDCDMEKKISKIVVVDSNEHFCQGLKDYFLESRQDLRVVSSFSNIVDAVDYISDNNIDIVITDIIIPNADGYDLISEIKKQNLAKEPKR